MSAGYLNQRIEIQHRVSVENTRGEVTYSYERLQEVFCHVNPKQGREFLAAAQLQGEGRAIFRIRFRAGLDETMRVRWKGEMYEVKAPPVAVDGGIEWMDLYCSKGIGDARKPG